MTETYLTKGPQAVVDLLTGKSTYTPDMHARENVKRELAGVAVDQWLAGFTLHAERNVANSLSIGDVGQVSRDLERRKLTAARIFEIAFDGIKAGTLPASVLPGMRRVMPRVIPWTLRFRRLGNGFRRTEEWKERVVYAESPDGARLHIEAPFNRATSTVISDFEFVITPAETI